MSANHTITDLNHLDLLCIAGESAKKLLQGQLTCNLDDISQESRLAAHCNPQGRIISFFRIFLFNDQYYLQMPRELIPIAQTALKKYAVFFKVAVNHNDTLVQTGFSGDQLENILGELPKKPDDVLLKENAMIIKLPGIFSRYEIIGKPENVANIIKKLNAKQISSVEWTAMDIAAGIPAIYPETSEKFLPHELNLQKLNAISFDKGCYIGQEIIARMQYRGKLKNHMYRAHVETDTPPVRGGEILNTINPCGNIVDFAKLSYNNYELLFIAPETELSSTLFIDAERKTTLKILALPYSL